MHREPECGICYCISSNNSRGSYFCFRIKRGWLFEGRRLFKIAHWKSCPNQVFQIYSYLINFQSLDCHWSVLLADSSSTWQAGNKRKRGVQGAIIWGRQLIEGWLLLEEIRYIIIHWNFPVFLSLFGRDFNQIEDGLGFKYSVHESCLVWGSCFSTASIIIGGSEWGCPLVGCRLKFTYFVGSRLKFSIFVGSRLNFLIFVGCWKISVNK